LAVGLLRLLGLLAHLHKLLEQALPLSIAHIQELLGLLVQRAQVRVELLVPCSDLRKWLLHLVEHHNSLLQLLVELLTNWVLLILHAQLVVLLAMLLNSVAGLALALINCFILLEMLIVDIVEHIDHSLLIK
jgi:hypothetical protein